MLDSVRLWWLVWTWEMKISEVEEVRCWNWFWSCTFVLSCQVRDIGINGGPVHGDEVPTNTPAPSTSGGGTQTPAATTRDASGLSRSLTVDQKREVRAAMSSPSVGKVEYSWDLSRQSVLVYKLEELFCARYLVRIAFHIKNLTSTTPQKKCTRRLRTLNDFIP